MQSRTEIINQLIADAKDKGMSLGRASDMRSSERRQAELQCLLRCIDGITDRDYSPLELAELGAPISILGVFSEFPTVPGRAVLHASALVAGADPWSIACNEGVQLHRMKVSIRRCALQRLKAIGSK